MKPIHPTKHEESTSPKLFSGRERRLNQVQVLAATAAVIGVSLGVSAGDVLAGTNQTPSQTVQQSATPGALQNSPGTHSIKIENQPDANAFKVENQPTSSAIKIDNQPTTTGSKLDKQPVSKALKWE